MLLFSSPILSSHSPPPGHPERMERGGVFEAVAAAFREGGGTVVGAAHGHSRGTARVHTADYLDTIEALAGRGGDAGRRHVHEPGDARRRSPRCRRRDRCRAPCLDQRGGGDGPGAAAGSSRRAAQGDGLLPLQQHRDRGRRPESRRRRAGGDCGLRRPSRQRHAGRVLRGPDGPVRVQPSVSLLARHRLRGRAGERSRAWRRR